MGGRTLLDQVLETTDDTRAQLEQVLDPTRRQVLDSLIRSDRPRRQRRPAPMEAGRVVPGPQTWPVFLGNIFLTASLYSVLTGLATIGEEFGWRGVLQGPMLREFGLGKGESSGSSVPGRSS